MNNTDNQVIITVSGTDKIGIVAGVSNKLLHFGVNIEDIKQTIMQNNFAMMMLCDIGKMEVSFKEFKDALMALGEELKMEIWVQKKDIFDKMHTV